MDEKIDWKTDPNNSEVKYVKYSAKCIMIGRLPRKRDNDFKTAFIKLFNINNPHKSTELPTKSLEIDNIEKIRLRRLNASYYLEGNDIIVNDIEEVYIKKTGNRLIVRCYQGSKFDDD